MNSAILPFAVLCGLGLAAVVVSLFAVFRAKAMMRAARESAAAAQAKLEADVKSMRETIEGLAAQVHEAQQQPRMIPVPAVPKPGMNLSKRSQALRMHRRGDGVGQIAEALDIPFQEVDLLLKVHRIVIGSIG